MKDELGVHFKELMKAEVENILMYSDDDVIKKEILGALNLYLDFVNLFLDLLDLFGKRRD